MIEEIKGNGEILIYQTEDGKTKIDVRFEDETVWLSQEQMAELFQCVKSNISMHLNNIFTEGELIESQVSRKFRISEFSTKPTNFYNLDAIISVGYRVNSHRGVQFRVWATSVLKEYLKKGFAMNDDLLKSAGGGNYFNELLQRIRDIRSSEKIFYRKILEIYALSIDYDPRAIQTQEFFATVQNKMHFSAHGKTAAEVIYDRADADADFMGLTSWSGFMPQKNDAFYAKNYLTEVELNVLNRIVNLYLEFAELQATEQTPMYMKDWIEALDGFLKLSRKDILKGPGKVSADMARIKAEKEYNEFRERTKNNLSSVEKHFLESIKKLEKISDENKK